MAETGEVAGIHGAEDWRGLGSLIEVEARMNRADSVVERFQKFVGIIERAVGKNIDLGGFQDAKSFEPPVQLVDETDLRQEVTLRNSARDLQALPMIAYTGVFVS